MPDLSIIIFFIFIGSAILYVLFCLLIYLPLARHKDKKKEEVLENTPSLSIVISARNEFENLKANVPIWCSQNHPDYQVIIANDRSWDKSTDLLRAFRSQYANLKVVEVTEQERIRPGKKWALFLAIKAAEKPNILLTDADCTPSSKNWASIMSSALVEKEIALGFAPHYVEKGLLNALIRYDTFKTAQQYMSAAKAGFTYMGVGRNLAYKKDLFMRQKGFLSNMKHPSGDDDLFVNTAANSKNTAIVCDPEAYCHSDGKKTVKDWFIQKFRHLSTGKYYKASSKAFLLTPSLLLMLVLASGLWLCHYYFWQPNKLIAIDDLIEINFRTTIEQLNISLGLIIVGSALLVVLLFRYVLEMLHAKKLDASTLGWLSPLLLPLRSIFRLIWGIGGRMKKEQVWR